LRKETRLVLVLLR